MRSSHMTAEKPSIHSVIKARDPRSAGLSANVPLPCLNDIMPGLIICNSREECPKRTPCDYAAGRVINSSDNLGKFAAHTLTCIIMTANVVAFELNVVRNRT